MFIFSFYQNTLCRKTYYLLKTILHGKKRLFSVYFTCKTSPYWRAWINLMIHLKSISKLTVYAINEYLEAFHLYLYKSIAIILHLLWIFTSSLIFAASESTEAPISMLPNIFPNWCERILLFFLISKHFEQNFSLIWYKSEINVLCCIWLFNFVTKFINFTPLHSFL